MKIGISLENFIANISSYKLSHEFIGETTDYNNSIKMSIKEKTENVLLEMYLKMFFSKPAKKDIIDCIKSLKHQGDTIYIISKQGSINDDFISRINRFLVTTYLKLNNIPYDSINFSGFNDINSICKNNDIDAYIDFSKGLYQILDVQKNCKSAVSEISQMQDKVAEIRKRLNKKVVKNNLTGIPSVDKIYEQYYTEKEKSYEIPKMSMYQYIFINNIDHLDDIAIRYQENTITFRKFFKRIDDCAKALLQSGIKKGDKISICMPNIPETIILFYALNKIGAIIHMLDPRLPFEEMRERINQIESKMLFFVDSDPTTKTLSQVDFIKETTIQSAVFISPKNSMPKLLKGLYTLVLEPKNTHVAENKYISRWDKFLNEGKKFMGLIPEIYEENKPAIIMNTGGTTGGSKGAVLSNEYYNSIVVGFKGNFQFDRGDEALSVLPAFHIFGLGAAIHIILSNGLATNLIPKFQPKDMVKTMSKARTNIVIGVPQILNFICNDERIKKMDLSCIKLMVSGGDSISLENEENINKFLNLVGTEIRLTKGYGLTEGGILIVTKGESNEVGSIGIPLPNVEVKFVDPETNREVGYDEKGEICISGNIMLEYYENKEETNLSIRIHEDGKKWLHTGDIGHINRDGIIFFDDRIKQIIISNGHNVYPNEIEKAIREHSSVKDCVVVGIPNKKKGRVPKAHIILKDGVFPTHYLQEEIEALCKSKLSVDAIPYSYKFRESFPLTLMNKVNRKMLESEDTEFDKTLEVIHGQKVLRRTTR